MAGRAEAVRQFHRALLSTFQIAGLPKCQEQIFVLFIGMDCNDRFRRILVIDAHSGEGLLIACFADLCQRRI
jgi:hypothetical protein